MIGFSGRAYLALAPTDDRDLVAQALRSLRPGEGTALGDAIALGTKLAEQERASDGTVPPTAMLVISDGAQMSGRTTPDVAAQQALRAHIPIYSVVIGTPDGVVNVPVAGGYQAQLRVPPSPDTLRMISTRHRRSPLHRAGQAGSAGRVSAPGLQAGTPPPVPGDHGSLRRRVGGVPPCRRRLELALVPESSMRRLLVASALAACIAAAGAVGARPGDERVSRLAVLRARGRAVGGRARKSWLDEARRRLPAVVSARLRDRRP